MAEAAYETYTVDSEVLTVDLILWRKYRRPIDGLVERTLVLNPGLAEQGNYLPLGTELKIPYVAPPKTVTQKLVRLWD